MGKSIVDIKNMGDALRNTGYKNIESAVSEIIDNSIEANAKNIFVILREGIAPSGRKVVNEIGFLDDGDGMDYDILGSCLGIGASTRTERKGMGRFGVGLPQASLYACPEVEVYSWQDGIENVKKVFLDINKIKEGIQTEIADPINTTIPKPYLDYIQYNTLFDKYDFSKSGTLVIWKNCDRINPKTRSPLTDRLSFSLGQKFRYFIHDNISKIKIICDENRETITNVLPNDPLFLMNDNCVLCDANEPDKVYSPLDTSKNLEPPFELYTADGVGSGEIEVPIKYLNSIEEIKESNVKIRFSIVKNKFYDETAFKNNNPGSSPLGKHAAKLEGISIIRARREIDFRRFDFYDVINEPQHRWWGCEIIFEPELDEAFGVSNNKQYVELKEIEQDDLDIEERDVLPIWIQLARIIKPNIKAMYDKNAETRKNTRSSDNNIKPSINIIKTVEENDYKEDSESDNLIEPEEKVEMGKKELIKLGYENPTDEQAITFFDNKINIIYKDLGERCPAFDYKLALSVIVITINTSHPFYKSFLSEIYKNTDAQITFELLLGSLFQAAKVTDVYQQDQNDRLFTEWYKRLNDYMREQINPRQVK